ncbi:MAG: hypothetical protein ACOZBL_01350 [Patescibacteria group bacterium]
MDYVYSIVPFLDEYIPLVANKVNANTTSFSFDEMDVIDRAIFLL